MIIPSTTSTTSASSSTSTSTSTATANASTVSYNEFLTLLVQQMKNQDPTAPSDPTQFMGELASFSQVEQQTQSNSYLSQMLTSNSLTQAEDIIGKSVSSSDGKTSGTVTSVTLGASGAATATLDNGATLPLANGVTIGSSDSSSATGS